MHELFVQLLQQVRGTWRYRWYAVLVTWMVSLAAWGYVYTLPDVYKSSARVQIDTESVLEPLLDGLAIQTDPRTKVDMMTRALLTRPVLEKVLDATGLGEGGKSPSARQALLHRLKEHIYIGGESGADNVYTIAYTDASPEVTQGVVEAVLDVLVEHTRGSMQSKASSAQRFLEQQIRAYEVRLTAAEQRLADFKKEHVGMMPSEARNYYARLQDSMTELAQTRAALRVAENRRRELSRQLAGEEPVFGLMEVDNMRSASSVPDTKIREHQAELDDLSLRYTDEHPDIVALQEVIVELEQRKQKKQQALSAHTSQMRPLEMNPIYQSMKISLSEVEVEIASLRTQMVGQQRRVEKLESMVDSIPEVEARLARLKRDYDVPKQQYDALVQRLETARLSEEAERSGERIEFRIIDPPTLPLKPFGPDRQLFNTAAFVAGVLAGIIFAFFLHQINPVFSDSRGLSEVAGYPVLGIVITRPIARQRVLARAELGAFVAVLTLLVMLYGTTFVFNGGAMQMTETLINGVIRV